MYVKKRARYFKIKVYFIITLVFTLLSLSFIYIDNKIIPTVQAIGDLRAREIITGAIHESIENVVKKDIKYKDLIVTKEDTDGNITFMQSNTIMMNRIAANTALTIQNHLKDGYVLYERIPLASILGSQLFAYYGPKFKLTMIPLGAVDVNFGTEFQQSGINQTRHKVFLTVNMKVQVIIPFNSNIMEVSNNIPIAETIIVGKVPQNYIYVPEDKFLNIAPLYEP